MDSDYISEIFSQVGVQDLTAGPVIALALAVLLLFASGFISASEVAFFSLKPNDINRIKEGNHPADSVILDLPNNSEFLLATILIANNFVNVAIVMLCTYGINEWLDFSNVPMLGFVLETIVLTFLLLLFGEIMPKIYAKQNTLPFIHKAAPTLLNIQKICKPLAALLVHSTSTINKTLAKKKYDISVDELSKALELTSKAIPEEKEMLAEIIKFYNKTADEIMTSRLDMEDLDIKANFKEVIDTIIKCGYSRIPVYSGTEDNIKGILYIKDLLPYLDKPETFRWQSLIRPAYFVPETKKIDDLLEEFRTNKIHMAIVVDEFGGTSGIVTMEDILEEIVGESRMNTMKMKSNTSDWPTAVISLKQKSSLQISSELLIRIRPTSKRSLKKWRLWRDYYLKSKETFRVGEKLLNTRIIVSKYWKWIIAVS